MVSSPLPPSLAAVSLTACNPRACSGQTMVPSPWTPVVLKIKVSPGSAGGEEAALRSSTWLPGLSRSWPGCLQEELESRCGGATFNSCLLNYYRDGNDNMGFHSDDEPLYGPNPTIGSVSFGSGRDFVLKLKADTSQQVKFSLGDGHILIMMGTTQELWSHGVPKRTGGVVGGRINLTFRNVLFPEAAGGPSKKGQAGKQQ